MFFRFGVPDLQPNSHIPVTVAQDNVLREFHKRFDPKNVLVLRFKDPCKLSSDNHDDTNKNDSIVILITARL